MPAEEGSTKDSARRSMGSRSRLPSVVGAGASPAPVARRPSVAGSIKGAGGSFLRPIVQQEIPQPAEEAVFINKVKGTNNLMANGRKIKSAANALIKNTMWRAPLQTHNLRDGTVAFVTIRVRVMLGDAEQDVNIKFDQPNVLVESICQAVALKQSLSKAAANLFSLWIIGKDLELQLRPEMEVFEFMKTWNTLVLNNTHFPEARNYYHPINHHWFVYRKESSISTELERGINDETCIILLYGEARRNILTGRYPCSVKDACILAGLQLQMFHGDYGPSKAVHLKKQEDLRAIVPIPVMKKLSRAKWTSRIIAEYVRFVGMRSNEARAAYLVHARTLPCYGSVFFPVAKDIPPRKYFEFRQMDYHLGLHSEGVVVIDRTKKRSNYLYQLLWPTTSWSSDEDNITFYYIKPTGKHKRLFLVTPQARIIANLAQRVKACWALRALGHNEPIAYRIIKQEEEEARRAEEDDMRQRMMEDELLRAQQRARANLAVTKGMSHTSLHELPLSRTMETPLVHANSLGNLRARELGGSQGEGLTRSGSVRSLGSGGRSSRNSILDLNKLARGGKEEGEDGSNELMESVESNLKEEEYMARVRTSRSTVLLTKAPKRSMSQIYKSLTTSTSKRISKASFDYDQFLTVAGPADVVDMRENRPEGGDELHSLPSKRY